MMGGSKGKGLKPARGMGARTGKESEWGLLCVIRRKGGSDHPTPPRSRALFSGPSAPVSSWLKCGLTCTLPGAVLRAADHQALLSHSHPLLHPLRCPHPTSSRLWPLSPGFLLLPLQPSLPPLPTPPGQALHPQPQPGTGAASLPSPSFLQSRCYVRAPRTPSCDSCTV